MFYKNGFYKTTIIGLLIFLTILTRFYGLNWGGNYFFHPDENNMARAVSQMSLSDLNPRFFAYGQFPLYLAFFTGHLINFLTGERQTEHLDFSQSVYLLRFWSAFFSSLTVFLLYLLGQKLFNRRYGLLFVLLIIFTPGLIQLAHFGTTESFLIMVFVANILLGLTVLEHDSLWTLLLASLVSGLGLGSKITAIILTGPVFLALAIKLFKNRRPWKFLSHCFVFILAATVFGLLASPYNLLDFHEFLSSMNYETSVATGSTKVFYTNQFLGTIPYLFQFLHIFPFANGITVIIFSAIGLAVLLLTWRKLTARTKEIFLVVLIPSLVYFLYAGHLYTKWSRFMSPVFFIMPLFSVYLLKRFGRYFVLLLTTVLCLPGIIFFNIYLNQDIRVRAAEWTKNNIASRSIILSEQGNVIDFPPGNLFPDTSFFDFYELDTSARLKQELIGMVYASDYIIIPSRRVFKNQKGKSFPVSSNYYKNLFNGKLGFVEIKQISPQYDLLLNSEDAEETWTVFDHPTIRIFKKTDRLSVSEIKELILDNG